ncbi:MAG: hypothetical protein R3E98_19380 [Gemmatimonadota bacterium]
MIESFHLHSTGTGPPLRIGVMIDGSELIDPFAEVLRHIRDADFAELALVIRHVPHAVGGDLTGSRPVRWAKALADPKRRRQLLYSRYLQWDAARNPAAAATLDLVDCSDLFEGVPEVAVTPLGKGFVHRFPADALAEIRSRDLDVILRFGFNILKGEILDAARYGIWSYHHGDNDFYRGGPPMFWEVAEDAPLTGTILQVLNETLDAGLVLAKTLAPTELGMSRAANLPAAYRAAEPMVIEKLQRLHERGWQAVQAEAVPAAPFQGRKKLYRTPDNREMVGFLGGKLGEAVRRRLARDPRLRHWQVALRPRAGHAPWEGTWRDFRWLRSPRGHYYADPFLFEHQGRAWLFVEDFPYADERGVIACAEIAADGRVGEFRTVLDRPYHLSFPFVFQQDGSIWMIPEALRSGRVELYRATSFPFRWELDHVLFERPGLDTILHVGEDGRHYFFTSLRNRPGAHAHLYLFTADDLHAPWRLHPASPLSRDARYARNAGALFQQEGTWVRPSQDTTLWYGRQTHFHAIERLTATEYREHLVGTRGAEWGDSLVGTHTYSHSARWEVIDGIALVDPMQRG